MKLRKKPVIIEANQYTHPAIAPVGSSFEKTPNGYLCIHDKDGIWLCYVYLGEWVCTDDGENYYVLSDAYIKEHFEVVNDA